MVLGNVTAIFWVLSGCAADRNSGSVQQATVSDAQRQTAAVWHVEVKSPTSAQGGIDGNSRAISFSFPPPHNVYAGEFARVDGWLKLPCDGEICGEFRVSVADLDMGETDLTRSVQFAAEMLQGETYPQAAFVVRQIAPQADVARFLADSFGNPASETPSPLESRRADRSLDLALSGDFQLKGVTGPMSVPVRLTPAAPGGTNAPTLLLTGSFTIDNLTSKYNLAVPEPGDPASDRVVVHVRLGLARH